MKTEKQLQQEKIFAVYIELAESPLYEALKKMIAEYEGLYNDPEYKRTLENQLDEKKAIEEFVKQSYLDKDNVQEPPVSLAIIIEAYEAKYGVNLFKQLK